MCNTPRFFWYHFLLCRFLAVFQWIGTLFFRFPGQAENKHVCLFRRAHTMKTQNKAARRLWARFVRTGRVGDYLLFTKQKSDSEDAECNKPYLPL